MTPLAEELLQNARVRIAEHHLVVARFYKVVEQPYGVERMARLALGQARLAGDAGRVEEAEALLAEVVEREPGS